MSQVRRFYLFDGFRVGQVWPDSFVEENNLAQNISILRKALGEGKEGEHCIQTVPKRGYRFVADVRSTGGDDESVIVRERTRARIVVERDDEDRSLNSAERVCWRSLMGQRARFAALALLPSMLRGWTWK